MTSTSGAACPPLAGSVLRERVDRVLLEYETVREPAADPVLEALKAAVFVEHAFGITLTDAEIDLGILCDVRSLRAIVLGRLGAD